MKIGLARCHILARVLAADGIITSGERAALHAAITYHGLTQKERDQVIHFEGVDGASAALSQLAESEKREILDELLEAALLDGNLSPLELQVVEEITQELGLADS
jgi:uncharacterized tellurite resistance protein B-like protein